MKKNNGYPSLPYLLSAAVAATALPTMYSHAEEARRHLEEVIVTARKRDENIQEVPVAITAMSGDDLVASATFGLKSVDQDVPSLLISNIPGNSTAPIISLRGQVQNDSLITLDPSVGVYVDDIYLGRAPGAMLDFYDVESLEVLAGPQGTLYGRNTTGGAIKIATRRADPGAGNEGYVSQNLGNYNNSRTEAALNVPLIEDVLAMRVALMHHERDGWGDLTLTDNGGQPLRKLDADDKNVSSGRFSVVLNADDNLSFALAGDYSETNSNGPALYNLKGGDLYDAANSRLIRSSIDDHEWRQNHRPLAKSRAWGVGFTSIYTWDLFELKFILGHREVTAKSSLDVDGTTRAGIATVFPTDAKQDTAELQLNGSSFDDRLSWVTGLYYFTEEGRDTSNQTASANPAASVLVFPSVGGTGNNDSASAYVHTTYAFTDTVDVSVGLRYTQDEKDFKGFNWLTLANGTRSCRYLPGAGIVNDGVQCSSKRSDSFEHLSWSVGVNWRIADEVMAYVKGSNGYRSGGQNSKGTSAAALIPFDEETVTDVELGLKSSLFERRMRLNAAYYHSFYDDIQQSIVITQPTVATIVANQGKADIDGVELQATLLAIDALTLNATASYIDVQFEDSATVAQLTPQWKWSLSAQYVIPAEYGSWSFRVNYAYRDEYYKSSSAAVVRSDSYATVDTVGLTDARIALTLDEYAVEVALYGTNITNEKYAQNTVLLALPATSLSSPNAFALGQQGEPRMYGIEVRKKF